MEIIPDTSKEAIGGRLVAVRLARDWNSATMAEAIGVSPQRWSNYETGKTGPSPDILAKVWQVTGATSDFVLFGRYDGMPYELAQRVRDVIDSRSKDGSSRPSRRSAAR